MAIDAPAQRFAKFTRPASAASLLSTRVLPMRTERELRTALRRRGSESR